MLRRLFMASVAATALASPTLAADLAPIAAAPAFTWAGFKRRSPRSDTDGARTPGTYGLQGPLVVPTALPGRLRSRSSTQTQGRYGVRAIGL